jgi:CarD family transcriptional regulator
MDYTIGQTIIHPAHGPGEIVGIEHHEFVEGFKRYYVIRFADKQLTVRVPFRRIENVGLREVMSSARLQQVMATLRGLPNQLPKDFKARRKKLEALIFSGAPIKVAEAVRELTWRRVDKSLNIEDKRLLEHGRELLIQEMALVTNDDPLQIQTEIDEALATAVKTKTDTLEH